MLLHLGPLVSSLVLLLLLVGQDRVLDVVQLDSRDTGNGFTKTALGHRELIPNCIVLTFKKGNNYYTRTFQPVAWSQDESFGS